MCLAGKTDKKLYPCLIHVTCIAYSIHYCAMRVQAHCKEIDYLIASVKAATIKNKDQHNDFREAGLPAPSDPVLSRWST